MTKLYEKLSEMELDIMVPGLQEKLLDVAIWREEHRSDTPGSKFVVPSEMPNSDQEVTEPLLRYIHGQMMAHATKFPSGGAYTHMARIRLSDAIDTLKLQSYMDKTQRSRLASQLVKLLKKYKLAENTGRGSMAWRIRPWPENVRISTTLHYTTRAVEAEAQRQQAHHPEEPVKCTYDIKMIPSPEGTPESFVKYIEKVVKTFDQLQHAYQDTLKALEDSEAARVKAVLAVEELTNDEWAQAANKVQTMMTGAINADS